jgi:ABC-type multidrug transport system fused ATPase/permease subunit
MDSEDETPYLASLFFQLIPPIQYIHCVLYFQTDHFEHFYLRNRLAKGKLNRISALICMLSLINTGIHVVSLFVRHYDTEFPYFFTYHIVSKVLISILLVLSWIYGSLILFTNLSCFCLVFWKHSHLINDFCTKVKSDENEKTINEITQHLLYLIHNLKNSINDFQNIFSSFTFLGAIAFGFFIDRIIQGNFDFFPWNTFVVYVIMQIIFFFILVHLSSYRNGMSDLIRNPEYVFKYIRRYNIEELKRRFDENEEQYIIINLIEENGSLVDWTLLNDVINDDWTEFKFFGINIADFELIKRASVVIAFIIFANSIVNESLSP